MSCFASYPESGCGHANLSGTWTSSHWKRFCKQVLVDSVNSTSDVTAINMKLQDRSWCRIYWLFFSSACINIWKLKFWTIELASGSEFCWSAPRHRGFQKCDQELPCAHRIRCVDCAVYHRVYIAHSHVCAPGINLRESVDWINRYRIIGEVELCIFITEWMFVLETLCLDCIRILAKDFLHYKHSCHPCMYKVALADKSLSVRHLWAQIVWCSGYTILKFSWIIMLIRSAHDVPSKAVEYPPCIAQNRRKIMDAYACMYAIYHRL